MASVSLTIGTYQDYTIVLSMALRWSPPDQVVNAYADWTRPAGPLGLGGFALPIFPQFSFSFSFIAASQRARAHALSVLGAVGAHLFNHAHAGWPWLQLWEE
ncbi:hypothetical protein A9K55_003600 [Cordyceps militaris]|uniref:Uncharacterized protein n=1 Tax=Cordyceps militaris TaxID=73501 RepID=A0A2H4S7Q0_CORMI|nr:hypothetical protein A9K55_003600 [Cordyceps militaris]